LSATWHIASSGFVTTMMIAPGLTAAACFTTAPTMPAFLCHQVVAAHAGLAGKARGDDR